MKQRFFSGLFRNLPYKIAAVVLGCLFWYIVQGEEILEVNRRIVVNIKVPDGLAIKGAETRIKDATLRGSRALLGDFSTKPLEATLTVPDGRVGQLRYRIDKEYLKNWDNRIKLTVHDPYINVYVDHKITKKVPIKEYLTGVPADGYIIEKTFIKPNTVVVTGLESELSQIDQILTEPIDVEGLSQTKSYDIKLVAKDLPKSALSVDKVSVNLMVGEKKINKRFGSVPIEVTGSDFLTVVKPRFVAIEIQGTPGVLSFVKSTDLEAFVEARELEPGKKHNRPIQVKIPPDTVLIETVPQSATVEVYNQKRLD
jgi:YbbR domain-containing protein